MKSASLIFPAMFAFISQTTQSITLENAQSVVDELSDGGVATEIRTFGRGQNQVYEIEYVVDKKEYEIHLDNQGQLIEHYYGLRLPVTMSLAVNVSDQIYADQDTDPTVIPVIIGDWGRFWFRGLNHGFYAYRNSLVSISPMIKLNFDRGYETSEADSGSNLYDDLDDTTFNVSAGAQILFNLRASELEINLLTDVVNEHKGDIAEIALSAPMMVGDVLIKPEVRFSYNDSDVAQYYFGVNERYSLPGRQAYIADSSVNAEISAIAMWNVSPHWQLLGKIGYRHYDESIEDSPLVDEVDELSAFVGLGYVF